MRAIAWAALAAVAGCAPSTQTTMPQTANCNKHVTVGCAAALNTGTVIHDADDRASGYAAPSRGAPIFIGGGTLGGDPAGGLPRDGPLPTLGVGGR